MNQTAVVPRFSSSDAVEANAWLIEEFYKTYLANPDQISPQWRAFFDGYQEGFGLAKSLMADPSAWEALLRRASQETPTPSGSPSPSSSTPAAHTVTSGDSLSYKWQLWIREVEQNSHLAAWVNPLKDPPSEPPYLTSFSMAELDAHVPLSETGRFGLTSPLNGHDFLKKIKDIYNQKTGIEMSHLTDPQEVSFLREALVLSASSVSPTLQKHFFTELCKADALEKTIATKFIGKKRFSIEGADAQLVALETIAQKAQSLGAQEITVAMAHRGRLNLLVNFIGKPAENLFAEFTGKPNPNLGGDGDVKYHGGHEGDHLTRGGSSVRVSMSSNPSHLEFVDPVLLGETKAKQDLFYKSNTDAVVGVLLHGDAAFAGQGVVYESMQMMLLEGYQTGGTIHIVANNQVGFTTNPSDARSSRYCSDIGKMLEIPVFHVNGECPESVHKVMEIATEYRYRFKKDVIVDIVCYRRHGHNESDEPTFSQPTLYKLIKDRPAPYEVYGQTLYQQGVLDPQAQLDFYQSVKNVFEGDYDRCVQNHTPITLLKKSRGLGASFQAASESQLLDPVDTGVPSENLKELGRKLVQIPEGFTINPKLGRTIVGERLDMLEGKKNIDWGLGELLAYASLLQEGTSVRLMGQDARRGTFSHRHVVFTDFLQGNRITPIQNCASDSARFTVSDSLLSETAALGFEHGYSLVHDNCLTLWEAQFGDFANGAQVIIDQFITCSETKWGLSNGLVLLLPHGYEGQGPEHSSARMERFLQSAAEGNIQLCIPTTSAQLFHLLRRQIKRNFRKPLIILSPKSYLRNPRATSPMEDFTGQGPVKRFEEILRDERHSKTSSEVRRVVLCTGKLSIESLDYLAKQSKDSPTLAASGAQTSLVKLEQIYPLHLDKLSEILRSFPNATQVIWAQEEPKNMGAYSHLAPQLSALLKKLSNPKGSKWNAELVYIGRRARASTAVGIEKAHQIEQEKIWEAVWTSHECLEI